MNVTNNKRHQETIAAIDRTFLSLLKEKDLKDISVSELCEKAEVNRSMFYDNYTDMFTLANVYAEKIEKQVEDQLHADGEFAWIFEYIKANTDEYVSFGECVLFCRKNLDKFRPGKECNLLYHLTYVKIT